jgi:hypothetical protein
MVSGEYPANHILIDLNAEGQSSLLGDSGTTQQWIPLLHLDHGFNQFLSGSLRTRLGPGLGGEQQPVFSLFQRFVKVQESRRLQNDRGSDPAAGAHKQCTQTGDQSVRDAKVRGPLAGTIVDQQLVLDEDGLGNNRAQASWTKEAEERRDEMDKKDDDLAHHGIINNMAKSVKLRAQQQFASDRYTRPMMEILTGLLTSSILAHSPAMLFMIRATSSSAPLSMISRSAAARNWAVRSARQPIW